MSRAHLAFSPLLAGALLAGAPVLASSATGSGADALLQAVGGGVAPAPAAEVAAAPIPAVDPVSQLRPANSFEVQLLSEWRVERALPYEVNAWVTKILTQRYAEAAHLWTAIDPYLPESFRAAATIAQDYLYWKLDLPQTFVDQWVARVAEPGYATSRMAAALEQTVAPGFDAWLAERAPQLSAEQVARLRALDTSRSPMQLTAQAYALRRAGLAARPALEKLPTGHRYRADLARTVALALARTNDLAGAGRVLKSQLEPELTLRNDPRELARHYLQVARLLYQAGALEAAETYYQRVPNSMPEYLTAREEITWIWLRAGDGQKLRGSLETLNSKLFDERFAPEVPLVRAVSNLKLCYYAEVERDFARFQATSRPWARRITEALASNEPPAAPTPDTYAVEAERAAQVRQDEMARVAKLGDESVGAALPAVGAALPAVGPQLHWKRNVDRLAVRLEEARKSIAQERRRQWSGMRQAMTEAIRKLQFVKVELLTQTSLAAYRADGAGAADVITTGAAAPARGGAGKTAELKRNDGEIGFAFDGVIWPDELFRLRALAPGRCAGQD
jgi:hypothetical protein